MRLQWKYALIVNLAILAVLLVFYVLDEFRAKHELSNLYTNGLESGAGFRAIAENTIRMTVVDEIERWQSFNQEAIEGALSLLKREHRDLEDVVDINVTHGDTQILAGLLPGKRDEVLHINLTLDDVFAISQQGAKLYPIEGKYETAVIVPYGADLITQTDTWLLFSVGLQHQHDLDKGRMPEALIQTFAHNGILLSTPSQIEIVIKEKGTRWLVTDTGNAQRYFIWQEEDLLDIHVDNRLEKEQPISGYIQVIFRIPEIPRFINSSRLMHLALVFVVSSLLVIIINITTTRLIMRPLEQMMEIVRGAEAGNPDALQQSYSSGEIGRITHSLVRMLRQLKDAHSKRIAALEQFAGVVAHEIRNPLNSIGMTAQHLKSIFSQREVRVEDVEEAQELLDIVNDEIAELKQISEQFLTLNRPKHLNLEPTELGELLNKVLAEFSLSMKDAKINLVTNYDNALPVIQLDPGLIRQAFFNFIQNSIQAITNGGSIYITTRLDEHDTSQKAVVEIRDTGIGIPSDLQERIFDAYFTTKIDQGGVGLGLALSLQIITAHHGDVEVKSKVGMGSEFSILLPIEIQKES